MGTHLKALDKSYPMNTNMTGFWWFSQNICVLVLWTIAVSALKGIPFKLRIHGSWLFLQYLPHSLVPSSSWPSVAGDLPRDRQWRRPFRAGSCAGPTRQQPSSVAYQVLPTHTQSGSPNPASAWNTIMGTILCLIICQYFWEVYPSKFVIPLSVVHQPVSFLSTIVQVSNKDMA